MPEKSIEGWLLDAKAGSMDKSPLNLPYDEALREAVRAALFLKKRWHPKKQLPGLSGVVGLAPSTANELLSLLRAVQESRLRLLIDEEEFVTEPLLLDPKERARFVIKEIDAALSFLGPALSETEAARLLKLQEHPERAALAEASLQLFLGGYGGLAKELRGKLATLASDFDEALIDEAFMLITALDEDLSAQTLATNTQQQSRQNFYRLLTLMQERVGQIRKAAAYVYRHHPTILRQVTSAYDRQRRQRARKKKT